MSLITKITKLLSTGSSLKAIHSPHFDSVMMGNSAFEAMIDAGFVKYGLDRKRLSYIEKIHVQAYTNFDNLQPLSILQRDVADIVPILNLPGGRLSHSLGYTITFPDRSGEMIYKNLHIGSGRTINDYIVFLRYAANVHLASLALKRIDSIINDMIPATYAIDRKIPMEFRLEDILAKGEVNTIPDLTISMEIAWFIKKTDPATGDEITIYLFANSSLSRTSVTFDSKFVESAASLSDSEVIRQQLTQFIHDRGLLFLDAFDNLEALPELERVQVISQFIPQLMQHYVMVPANFAIHETNCALFATEAKSLVRLLFPSSLESHGIMEGSEAYELFFTKMEEHIDNHFASGKFVFKSEMEHPNL